MATGAFVAAVSLAANYAATWSNDQSITIGDVKYADLLSAEVWSTDPVSLSTGDSLLLAGGTAWNRISISEDAEIKAFFVAGTSNRQYDINLNGKTLTATGQGLRSMTSGTKFKLANGTLKFGRLLWPDRSAAANALHDNEFTVTGAGTVLDVNNLYFGYTMGSSPGQGYGNKIIVTNGAFMAANVYLAAYQSFGGAPNGLYVTGSGTVFSNKNANSGLVIQNDASENSYSNELVVADGAVVKGLDYFKIGATGATIYGEGHLLAFRGANTAHTFKGRDSSLGMSQRFEVDGAAITTENVTINNYGIMTVKNGGSIVGKIGQYGSLFLSGAGSRIEASQFNMSQQNVPAVRTEVADGAFLSCADGLQLGAGGCTNASIFVRNGGKVTSSSAYVGHASTNLTFDVAPYNCVLEVDGEGSVMSNVYMNVGTAINGAAAFSGCGTNGHDNVVRIMNGGRIWTNPKNGISIGFVCPSNSLEVLDGGVLECGTLYIGRAGVAAIGSFRASDVVFDNRCLVSGGTIESTGLISIRGNNSLCYVTNGVMHTTSTNSFDCETNTGLLQIAGTNSLLKGDLAFRVTTRDAKINFALPKEGYVRAPIQSDNLVSFPGQTVVSFEPPSETGKIADSYTLAQVPESGVLDVPVALLLSMRAAVATLGEQDERFAGYKVKVVVKDGYRRLVAGKPGGMIISIK